MGPFNFKDFKLSQVAVMKFDKDLPLSVLYKNSFEEDFKEAKILKSMKAFSTVDLLPCYSKRLDQAPAKKKDLMDLCKKNLIPRSYHDFYEKL